MSANAVQGHGASIEVEVGTAPGYVPVSGTFSEVTELGGDITWPSIMVPETEATAHNDNIDFWKPGVARREQLSFTINYVHDDPTHELFLASPLLKLERGFRLRGPNGSAGVDEVIASGFIQNVGPIAHPRGEGLRTAQINVRLSGPMIVNGVAYGD